MALGYSDAPPDTLGTQKSVSIRHHPRSYVGYFPKAEQLPSSQNERLKAIRPHADVGADGFSDQGGRNSTHKTVRRPSLPEGSAAALR